MRSFLILASLWPALAAGAAPEPANVFPQGNFETLEGGRAKGWTLQPGAELKTEGANHYLQFTSTTGGSAWALGTLKLDPEWSALRVSARMKVAGLKLGSAGWHNARCILSFRTAGGKDAGFPEPPKLTSDSDWVTQTVTVEIPENAASLHLQPGLWGCQGVMGLDDVVITPVEKPAPFDFRVVGLHKERGLVEGAFETLSTDGKQPQGWEWHLWARLSSARGNHWAKITNENPLAMPAIRTVIRVSPSVRKVLITARMKASGLKCGPEPWQNARVVVSPCAADGQPLPSLAGPALSKSSDWASVESVAALDPATRYLVLWAGLWQATGVLEIDDIQVTPTE